MENYPRNPSKSKPDSRRATLPAIVKSNPQRLRRLLYNEHIPPTWARLTCWRHTDYCELFAFIGATARGAYWNVKRNGSILAHDFFLCSDAARAYTGAQKAAREWVKDNLPGAVLRFRRIVDRSEIEERRRAA